MIRPSDIAIARSARSATTRMSCVIATIARPAPTRAVSLASNRWTLRRSCPNVGSSRNSPCCPSASMAATLRRRCSPWLSENGCAWATVVKPNSSSSASAVCRASGSCRPARIKPNATSSRTERPTNWCSGYWKTYPTWRATSDAFRPARSVPRKCTRPGGGRRIRTMWRARVLLPAPLAPTMDANSPDSSVKDTSASVGRLALG